MAYRLSCHLDPRHIARLCLMLTRDDPGCGVFVHVDAVTVFGEADLDRLRHVPHCFVRKVTGGASGALMDRIDALHADRARLA